MRSSEAIRRDYRESSKSGHDVKFRTRFANCVRQPLSIGGDLWTQMRNADFSEGNSFQIVIAPVARSIRRILKGRSPMSHTNKALSSSLKVSAPNFAGSGKGRGLPPRIG